MEHIETHSISPIYCQPGDTINLVYDYTEDGFWSKKTIQLDKLTEPQMIDTIIVYKVNNEYGLKSGRVIIMGETE